MAATAAALPRVGFSQSTSPARSREPLRELPYSAVQLTGGPFKEQFDALHAHYLSLDNDRLLKVYRQRAGLPAPGVDMGGWYDLNGFVPGHALGQFISGLARIGASTEDQACHEKVYTLVTGFGATLGANNQSILRPDTNLWPCYTLDKHLVGLIDSARLSNVRESKELLSRIFAGAKPLLPAQGRDRIGKKDPPYDETYVMPENLFSAYELTGDPALRELAIRYLLDREYFDPLARGANPLPGQHAYSHAIALSSAGKAYLTLGDVKYRDATRNAFTLLTTQQQFASGGWGPNETFVTPRRGELYASLSSTVDAAVEAVDVSVWDDTMRINLRGTMLASRYAIPLMRARGGGSIINTSSGAAQAGALGYSAYGVCKAGIEALTRYVAAQHGKEGIRCNAIAPGLIVTPATIGHYAGPVGEMMLSHHLTPRLGKPEDVAHAVVYLASDEAAFVTGQIINVDGGLLSHQPYYADEIRARTAGGVTVGAKRTT